MIYLSWSLAQVITVLVLMWVPYLINLKVKVRDVSLLRYTIEWLIGVLFLAFLAFDVGIRQEDLQRSSFDAVPPVEQQAKTERSTLDRNAVKQTFEQAVKETK